VASLAGRRAALSGANLAILLTLAHTANDAFTNILPVFLPLLQDRFALGEAALAGFVALISLSSNVMQAFMGALVDRWGRRRAAAAGLIVGSVLMSFLAVVPTVWSLFLLLAIGGLGSATFHPAAASMVHAAASRKGLGMGLFMAGGPLGSALMPVLVLMIIRRYGPEYVPWLAVIGVTLGILLFLLSPRQSQPEATVRPKVFDPELFRGPVGLLSLAGTLRAVAFISFANAMPLYLVNVRAFDPDSAVIGWTLACYGAAASAGVFLSGALEHRIGRERLAGSSMLLAVPLLLSTLVVQPGTLPYYLAVAAAGMFTNAAIPLLLVSAQDLAPDSVAAASGMLMGFTWGMAGILYVAFGVFQQLLGLVPALALSFTTLIPAAFVALWVMRSNRARLS
jgi:FSR family fosmidomycin resistance protein-like MFS transporter